MSTEKSEIKKRNVKILLLDQHPVILEGLRITIGNRPEFVVIDAVTSIIKAKEAIDQDKPDLLILDLDLEGANGLEFIKELVRDHPEFLILVLCNMPETEYANRCIQIGARGYIMKEASLELLITAIVTVTDGRIYLSEAVKTITANELTNGRQLDPGNIVAKLSDRELQIFREIGNGSRSRQIAEKLQLSIKTVEAHYANIKRKLKLSGSAALLRTAVHWIDASKYQ